MRTDDRDRGHLLRLLKAVYDDPRDMLGPEFRKIEAEWDAAMRTDDLPESKNVVDRRGKKEPKTLKETIAANQQEVQPERGAPDPDSPLAKQLGVDEIGTA